MSLISYNTPYDRAKALLQELVDYADSIAYALPTTRYAQIGDVVRDCESVIVSVGNLSPDPSYDPIECLWPRSATFLVEIIRTCAIAYDNQGLTIPSQMEAVSEIGGLDGQFLYDFAAQIDGWSSKQPWSVVWSLSDANMQVASLQITIGIS